MAGKALRGEGVGGAGRGQVGVSGAGTGAVKEGAKCPYNRHRSKCRHCGWASICEHNRHRSKCRHCGWASICEHNRIQRDWTSAEELSDIQQHAL